MSRPIIVLGDKTDHGGTVIGASTTTDIEGKGVARVGDPVICPKCNKLTHIISGDPTNTEDGKPLAQHGDKTSCGAMLISSQATTAIDPGAGARGSDLGGVAAGLATLVGQSNAIITASTTAASAAASILSGQAQSPSSTGQSYPRVEEAEEEEEIGEVEMGPKGPLDDDLEFYAQLYQAEINKLQAMVDAGDQAETAEAILSLLHMPSPKGVLTVISKAGANRIDDALRRGVGTLKSVGKDAIKEDLDRSRDHIREAIQWYEEQLSVVYQKQEARQEGREDADEFTIAREREELERYLNNSFADAEQKIIDQVKFARYSANAMKDESINARDKLREHRDQNLVDSKPYDPIKDAQLDKSLQGLLDKWAIAEGRLKEAELAEKLVKKEKAIFRTGDLGQKITSLEAVSNALFNLKSAPEDAKNPFNQN